MSERVSNLQGEAFIYGLEENDSQRFQTPDRASTPLWVFDYFEKPSPINGITISKPLIVAAQGMPQATLLTPTVLRFER